MKTFPLYLILGLCLFGIFSTSMAQQSVFNKVFYDLNEGLHVSSAARSTDNGYVLTGEKYGSCGHLIKIDSSGVIEWAKTIYSSNNQGSVQNAVCREDSTITSAGIIQTLNGTVLSIIKWNLRGDTLWTRNIALSPVIQKIRIMNSTDGSYLIIASNPDTYYLSNETACLIRLLEDGSLDWSKTYNSLERRMGFNAIGELPDGNIFIAGTSGSDVNNDQNLLIVRTDPDGNVIWSKSMLNPEGITRSEVADISVTPNGIVVYSNLNRLAGLIKTNFDGIPEWARNYNLANYHFWSDAMGYFSGTKDGGFILASSQYFGSLLKTDSLGIPQWLQSVFMDFEDVVPASDGGYMLFGNGPVYGVKSIPDFIPHIGAYKTDGEGNGANCIYEAIAQMQDLTVSFTDFNVFSSNLGSLVSFEIQINDLPLITEDTCVAYTGGINKPAVKNQYLKIYPNPANEIFSVEIPGSIVNSFTQLEIFRSDGNRCYMTTDPSCLRNGINPGYLPEGIYLVRLSLDNEIFSGKLLIKH
jgi:hypothetical protein